MYHSKDGTPLVGSEFLRDKRIWILHLLAKETPDNRLTHTFIQSGLLPALRDVRQQWNAWVKAKDTAEGAALVTAPPTDSKFFLSLIHI